MGAAATLGSMALAKGSASARAQAGQAAEGIKEGPHRDHQAATTWNEVNRAFSDLNAESHLKVAIS